MSSESSVPVLKFGGTSVGSAAGAGKIVEIVRERLVPKEPLVMVVSALSGVTDGLIAAARAAAARQPCAAAVRALEKRHKDLSARFLAGADRKRSNAETGVLVSELLRVLDGVAILGELSARTLDLVMSFGERLSASLYAGILTAAGIPSVPLDTRAILKTDGDSGRANVLFAETFRNIQAALSGVRGERLRRVFVTTGFIGSDAEGRTTTLGRGGSDLTAAVFGAALGVKEVEIWTDVDGILTADPRMVKNAFRIGEISYVEAMELSHFGARVIYPPTIRPALEKGIPIRVRNTFNPSCEGTRIVKDAAGGDYPIRGISSMRDIALVRLQGSGMVGAAGFSSRLFLALARRRINVILITQSSSEYSICCAVLPSDAPAAAEALRGEFSREIASGGIDLPVSETGLSIIAVVGSRMKSTSGISGKVFHALGRNGVNVVAIAQGSSELNISLVISRQDEEKALNAIHEAFFLSAVRSVNLFLTGTGLIGGTLLEQISGHREILADEYKIRINLVGAANSRRMVFRREGLDPRRAASLLSDENTEKTEPYSLRAFVGRMKELNLPNTAFCDCTASDEVSAAYAGILKSSVPVVTPNKRANAGSLEYYRELTGYSRERGIPYLYETTVCAGLPVISTLRDLFLSGDKVKRIEAVLSGTLSYIFNNFDGSKTFSALVREAKAKGYTEPDPRDDLNAMDAARKALILARECGMDLEFSNVAVEPILPAACFRAKDVDAFFRELEKADRGFEERRAAAAACGKALRYVAVIEEGAAKLSLRAEKEGSPFRTLFDSDNIVVITTGRYSKLPMVIKGPGAGAQVTAGGVFADIVRIARTLV
ncbi:MAG: bifunctional aspartate kinase/homoserine dehydrogenase I [Treponema sp.]|jgi:aspartokinase/homoserine dehydrogenase 1|nr:bifunctional aspartate kinase/homoserine dehydrogenase I [Treponema sp.]